MLFFYILYVVTHTADFSGAMPLPTAILDVVRCFYCVNVIRFRKGLWDLEHGSMDASMTGLLTFGLIPQGWCQLYVQVELAIANGVGEATAISSNIIGALWADICRAAIYGACPAQQQKGGSVPVRLS